MARPITVPADLRPTREQVGAAVSAYYAADRRARTLREQADHAEAEAETLRLTALDLCERERA